MFWLWIIIIMSIDIFNKDLFHLRIWVSLLINFFFFLLLIGYSAVVKHVNKWI
jgi:hypothetical protein